MDNSHQAAPSDPHETAVSAGALIRRKREQKGLSLVELAARTTVSSPQYLSTLEAGRVNVARSKHLGSIAAALDLTAEEQALILGMQHPVEEDKRPVANVFDPIDSSQVYLKVLTGETLLPCRVADEVVIINNRQWEPEMGRTYLIHPKKQEKKKQEDWVLAVCGADEDGKLSFVSGDRIYTLERVDILGRVLHRGRNL